MAKGYHKLLAYKDEYEVARLHAETLERGVAEGFTDVRAMRFHLAPPFLAKTGPDGEPVKRTFGPWMLGAFRVLRHFRWLRGTPLDPFGYTAERRMERGLIVEYESDIDSLFAHWTPATRDAAIALAALPLEIRGFGHVKARAAEAAGIRRTELRQALAAGATATLRAAE